VGPAGTRNPAPGGSPVAAPDDGATQLDPASSRADTDEVKFTETPTPLPASAKQHAVFSEPQPTRAVTSRDSRPNLSRAPTPADLEAMRGFADQRTPGFADQRTPGFFGDQRTPLGQRTPAEQRTPTDPGLLAAMSNPVQARVSTDNVLAAEAAFKRGELAMKRDQPGEAILEFKTACDLNAQEVDYAGMLAWAKFCAAGDKPGIGAETRKILERAVFKSQRPERARFYLGRVERMLGRDKEALRHFQEVLDLKPNHAEAQSEIRAIEARLAAASKGGSGLFGRKR
jgi:tetratricopeptide (TPR) repeat protein